MRGAAMKVGQMISMVEFDASRRSSRTSCRAGSRRSATDPTVPFTRLEKIIRGSSGYRSGRGVLRLR